MPRHRRARRSGSPCWSRIDGGWFTAGTPTGTTTSGCRARCVAARSAGMNAPTCLTCRRRFRTRPTRLCCEGSARGARELDGALRDGSVLPWRAFGELGAGLAEVPGDESADDLRALAGGERTESIPERFRQGDGHAESMPVLRLVGHGSHARAWLSTTQRSPLAAGGIAR